MRGECGGFHANRSATPQTDSDLPLRKKGHSLYKVLGGDSFTLLPRFYNYKAII